MKINKQVQRFFFVLLAIVMLATTMPISAFTVKAATTDFAGGSGTEDDPYLIETKEHLNNVRNDLGAHYKMIADIVFTAEDFEEGGAFYNNGYGWIPIGDSDTNEFCGIFDGNGYAIKNLRIDMTDAVGGFVGYNSGIIENLGMINCEFSVIDIVYDDEVDSHIGAISAINKSDGIVRGCYSVGDIKGLCENGALTYAGGIVGYNYGEIAQSYNSSKVYANREGGGIAGYNHGGAKINNCFNTGTIIAADGVVNGIAGGIVATNASQAMINNCYNIGAVYVSFYNVCGAIVGSNYSEDVYNCYFYSRGLAANGGANNPNIIQGVACSLVDMINETTFTSFDFDNIWEIDNTSGYPLPILKTCQYVEKTNLSNDFSGGSGTIFDPYIITTKEQLLLVNDYLDCSFKLENDIVFTENDFSINGIVYNGGQGWLPIGIDGNTPFIGTFDGNGKKITGLYSDIKNAKEIYGGLFGFNAGILSNITLEDISISVLSLNSTANAGGVCGRTSFGLIENCSVDGTIYAQATADYYSSYSGGIVGSSHCTLIENCTNEANVSSSAKYYNGTHAGGIVGSNSGATEVVEKCIIRNCVNKGFIKSTDNLGGIAGINSGTIYGCSNFGNCTAYDLYKGGIVGYNTGIVSHCGNFGQINAGSQYTGGIVGYNSTEYALIENCYNLGVINGSTITGGIAGYSTQSARISNCHNTGDVNGNEEVGGILGGGYSAGKISNCFNAGIINGADSVGGIAGYSSGMLMNCYNVGKIENYSSSYPYVGGIIGKGTASTNCYYLDSVISGYYSGSDTAIALSSKEMCMAESFDDFDFASVWTMDGNSNYIYPELINNNIVDISSIVTKEPTCVDDGVKTYIYSNGLSYDISIDKLGHNYKTTTTKATTSTNGKKVTKCTACGDVKSSKTIYRPSKFTLSTTSYTYNGYVKKPTVTIKDVNGNKLESGVDYTVSYASGRKLPGKYKVTVTFKGEYSGTKSLYFTIKPKAPSKLTVSSRSTSTIKLSWPKVTGATGYKVYRYNTSTGEYKLIKTLTTSTSLNVTGLKSATNYRYAVRAYKKASDGTIILSARKVINTATRPVAPFINSINSPSKGKVSLMWSDVARESGYQIYYSTSKTGTYKLYDMTSVNDVFETYTGFKSGRTYYFKVRAFKTVNGNKVYSSFSAVKGRKIK